MIRLKRSVFETLDNLLCERCWFGVMDVIQMNVAEQTILIGEMILVLFICEQYCFYCFIGV